MCLLNRERVNYRTGLKHNFISDVIIKAVSEQVRANDLQHFAHFLERNIVYVRPSKTVWRAYQTRIMESILADGRAASTLIWTDESESA